MGSSGWLFYRRGIKRCLGKAIWKTSRLVCILDFAGCRTYQVHSGPGASSSSAVAEPAGAQTWPSYPRCHSYPPGSPPGVSGRRLRLRHPGSPGAGRAGLGKVHEMIGGQGALGGKEVEAKGVGHAGVDGEASLVLLHDGIHGFHVVGWVDHIGAHVSLGVEEFLKVLVAWSAMGSE